MKLVVFIIFLLLAFPIFGSSQKINYIGFKHKGIKYGETLSNGVKDLGGGLLSNENYGVSRFSKGKNYMLWLEKITGRDKQGVPDWEVKDVLNFDNMKKNQDFMFSLSSSCLQNGKPNMDLLVMTELSSINKTYKILRAWKANTRIERFEKVSTKGIKCEYVAP